jgi:hypothetical protein
MYLDFPSVVFRVNGIKNELAQQIRADFEEAFQGPTAKVSNFLIIWTGYWIVFSFKTQYGPGNQAQLAEACFVVNVLDPRAKKDLLAWFVKLQLSEYVVLFAEDQDVCFVFIYVVF